VVRHVQGLQRLILHDAIVFARQGSQRVKAMFRGWQIVEITRRRVAAIRPAIRNM
jgi:hypothetical protein